MRQALEELGALVERALRLRRALVAGLFVRERVCNGHQAGEVRPAPSMGEWVQGNALNDGVGRTPEPEQESAAVCMGAAPSLSLQLVLRTTLHHTGAIELIHEVRQLCVKQERANIVQQSGGERGGMLPAG